MERCKLLANLGKSRRQRVIKDREQLLKLIDNNRDTGSESSKSPFKEDESFQNNISNGFFEKNTVLTEEVIQHLIEDLHDVSAMKTKEFDLNLRDKPSFSASPSRSATPLHSRSELQFFNSENIEIDNTDSNRKLSGTPIPSEYNSFTSSPPRVLSEVNQNVCLLNSGRLSSSSLLNFQSSTINTSCSDASSAVEASSECSTPSLLNDQRKRRKFSIDRSKKKRLSNKNKWIDTRRKLLLNSGKEHQSRNGKVQPAKHIKPPCNIFCKFNCSTNISLEDRKLIFDRFWDLCDHEKQWIFIGKYTKRCMKKRCTTDNDSKRKHSVNYTLPVNLKETTQKCIKVCKTMFKNTLNVSNQFIQSALDKYDKTTGNCERDFRGHHNNKKKVLTAAIIKGVCDHVNSFQPVESHYTRKDTNKVYLNDLSFSIMFKLYQTWAEENNIAERVQTVRQYRDIVNKEMNIAFFVPKKDQCDICIAFKNSLSSQTNARDYNKHIQEKNIARSLKKQDKIEAVSNPETVTSATFDFQKILTTPHGETSSFYYKRKLSVFNFTVFDMGLKKGICYMWPETIAKRGSNEVASCLYNFIKQTTERGIKDFRLWSDNCGGQNRNRIVFLMYVYCSQKYNIDIHHRFLEKGHTQQEGDSVHALIEKTSKRKFIYCPQEWYTLVRWCKTSGDSYEVVEMTQDEVFDFKMRLNDFKLTKNTDNQNVKWNQVREIVVKAGHPNTIFYKYDLHEVESKQINIMQKRNTRSRSGYTINDPVKCYNVPIMITSSKYKDLLSLCQQNLIPPRYHSFYENLKHGNDADGNETD